MSTLQQGTLLQGGRYKILSTLGQGGFGITYLALQSGLERKVAIKEFFMKDLCNRDEATSHVSVGSTGSVDMVERFKAKFLKEARNMARLNHPNIVRIHDIFEENGTAYYVMEYAEGGSLADKVKRLGYVPEPDAVRYIRQIADALGYIHMQKMNHLDVKPANIMLSEADDAILIDFGLSKQYDATTGNQTSTTPVGISDGYAPMEQYRPGGVGEFSPETDIYSLGATLFKLVTGITPPSASDVNEDGVPVAELKVKGVSQSSIDVICKTMEGRKRDRLKNVAEFIGLLDEHTTIIEGNAKPLPPPPVSPRTLEFECRLYVNTSDARYGILTVDTQKAEFKTKGIMSFLQGGGNMRFPIRSIIGISLRKHYGMTLGSVMVLTILDEYGNVFELSGKGIYQESSNVKTLTDIAYTLELYRRLYWIYDTVQQGYFALEESESDILRLNELSVEQLAERVRGL